MIRGGETVWGVGVKKEGEGFVAKTWGLWSGRWVCPDNYGMLVRLSFMIVTVGLPAYVRGEEGGKGGEGVVINVFKSAVDGVNDL